MESNGQRLLKKSFRKCVFSNPLLRTKILTMAQNQEKPTFLDFTVILVDWIFWTFFVFLKSPLWPVWMFSPSLHKGTKLNLRPLGGQYMDSSLSFAFSTALATILNFFVLSAVVSIFLFLIFFSLKIYALWCLFLLVLQY